MDFEGLGTFICVMIGISMSILIGIGLLIGYFLF